MTATAGGASVQYERLRPAQIAERRRTCPVAYLPIGTLEWHGEHNPVGLDTLRMHALLVKCAEAIVGAVAERVKDLRQNRDRYQGHGAPM